MSYMSQEGYDKLRAQIKQLEEVERPEVIRQIQEAREKGDLSENAEYDAAKEAQGKLETKIAELKAALADAKILDTSKVQTDTVQILSKVDLKNVKNGMKMTYTIVSESEAARPTCAKEKFLSVLLLQRDCWARKWVMWLRSTFRRE